MPWLLVGRDLPAAGGIWLEGKSKMPLKSFIRIVRFSVFFCRTANCQSWRSCLRISVVYFLFSRFATIYSIQSDVSALSAVVLATRTTKAAARQQQQQHQHTDLVPKIIKIETTTTTIFLDPIMPFICLL